MKLPHPALLTLFLLQYSNTLPTSTAQTCSGVSGSFSLKDISGKCSYAKLLYEYTRQVFNVTGSTCRAGSDLSAKEDFDVKLIVAIPDAGSAEAAATSICMDMYDNPDIVTPYYIAADKGTDYNFEQMFYNGLTTWQDEVETIYESDNGDATSILQTDASKVKEFYEGAGKYGRVEWPSQLTNFEPSTCTANVAMCCWPKDRQANDNNGNCAKPYDENCVDKDPADNTNLCFADLKKGGMSSGYYTERGFTAYPEDNASGEGAIHCHGFAWANDEYDTISRYKGNNLFYVSMYDHLYQRGYVKNIPGMPMCGCIDQMPMVTRSDCTQVDLTEEWDVDFDDNAFIAKLTKVEIAFNACQGRNNRNNDLWAYTARLYDEGRITNRQFGQVGRVITDSSECHHETERAKQQKGFRTGFVHDKSTWTKVAGRDDMYTQPPMGSEAFTTSLSQSLTSNSGAGVGAIVMRICATCTKTHKKIYYRRLTSPPQGFDVLQNILVYSSSVVPTGNEWGVDFSLHSTYEEATSGLNPWKCPDGKFNYYHPFVGDCSPSGVAVTEQFSIFNWGSGPRLNVAYYLNKPESTGLQIFQAGALTTDLDIGIQTGEGITFVDGDVIYIRSKGNNIWGQVDQFRYLSQPWEGDIDVSVYVKGFTNPNDLDWAKFGIMLRSDNNADAANVFMLLSSKQGVNSQSRQSKNRPSEHWDQHKTTPFQTSAWLRIVKKMDRIEFYRGNDGINWTHHGVGSRSILFPNDKYRVGLAVSCNADWAEAVEGTFEHYKTETCLFPTSAPSISMAPTQWDPLVDIGKVQRVGEFSQSADGTIDYVRGSGTGIWGTSDSFAYYNTQETISPQGGSVKMYIKKFSSWSNNFARGGIMFRDSRDSNAANVFLGASGRSGVTFQSRKTAGAKTFLHNMIFTNEENKMWVKLDYTVNGTVQASYKNLLPEPWTVLGKVEMEITGETIQVGRAVTAGTDYQWALEELQTQSYQVVS